MKTKIFTCIIIAFLTVQCQEKNSDQSLKSKKTEKKSEIKNEKSKLINSNRFLKPDEIRGKNFDTFVDSLHAENGVIRKHLPIESETFIMGDNDSWLAGIRQGLLEIHPYEEIEKKDFIIKEVTWEISDTEFMTVWYERKNRQWVPIQDFIWTKGTDF